MYLHFGIGKQVDFNWVASESAVLMLTVLARLTFKKSLTYMVEWYSRN